MFNHAVVAKSYITSGHLEGSVMVGTFDNTGSGSGPNVNNEGGKVIANKISHIFVNKEVINGEDGTFSFGFFDSVSGSQVGSPFDITTTNLKGGIDIKNDPESAPEYVDIFSKLDSGAELYVYELNNGNKVLNKGENGKYTVTYSYSDILGGEQEEIANNHDDNYIGEFVTTTKSNVAYSFFGNPNTVMNYVGKEWHELPSDTSDKYYYFGSNQNFYVDNVHSEDEFKRHFTCVEGLRERIESKIDEAAKFSVTLADAHNYPKQGQTGDTDKDLINVINLKSTTGKLTTDLKAAGFETGHNNEKRMDVIEGLLTEDQYLLINISVSGDAYNLDASEIYYDGETQAQTAWNALSSHIIYNFVGPVEKDDGDNLIETSVYSGNIKISSSAAGLLLAPGAKVDQTSAVWNGEIIAKEVEHSGQEIHEKPIISGKAVTVNVTNTGKYDVELLLHKYLDGELSKTPFTFNVNVRSNNNQWTEITKVTNSITDTDPGKISIQLNNMSQYKINNALYFLINEENSSNFITDKRYILVKVTDLDKNPHDYKYYRLQGAIKAEDVERYILEENRLSDDNEAINKKIAFVNESYKLKVRKEWKDQNGNLITDETMTDTFSGVNLAVMRTCDGMEEPEIYWKGTLSKGNTPEKWEVTLKNVPRYSVESGKEYTYYIQELNGSNEGIDETPGIEYYSIVGETKSKVTTNYREVSISLGSTLETLVLVCINTRSMNVLPSTGGVGDIPYMATGLGTAVAGLVGAKAYSKKKKKDDEE